MQHAPQLSPPLYTVKRTEWSPIRFVIIQVINKFGRLRSGSPIGQTELDNTLDNTKPSYQLIKIMTKFEKETRLWLYVFIKNRSKENKNN